MRYVRRGRELEGEWEHRGEANGGETVRAKRQVIREVAYQRQRCTTALGIADYSTVSSQMSTL